MNPTHAILTVSIFLFYFVDFFPKPFKVHNSRNSGPRLLIFAVFGRYRCDNSKKKIKKSHNRSKQTKQKTVIFSMLVCMHYYIYCPCVQREVSNLIGAWWGAEREVHVTVDIYKLLIHILIDCQIRAAMRDYG